MKIAIDLTSLADNYSGIEKYAASITRELIKDKNNEFVLLFKNSVHPIFHDCMNREYIEIKIINGNNKLVFNQILLPLKLYTIKADYFLFLAFPVPILFFKKNMISTIHDICCWDCPETMNSLSALYFRVSHRLALIKCRAILTISDFSRKRIIEKLKASNSKIWIVSCGIDEKYKKNKYDEIKLKEIRRKYNLPREYCLSVSTLEPRKNLQLLVDVYCQLVAEREIQIPLVLVGRKGWKIDKLFDSVECYPKDSIIFTGFVEEADLPYIYAGAEVFVFPSIYEGFGLPPLEALACGTKVISSDAASMPEVLGDEAIWFKSKDAESLMDAIKTTLDQESMVVDSKRAIQFSWEEAAKKLLYNLNNLNESKK